MHSFSIASSDKLRTCHRDLQTIMREAILGPYDFTITCGHRDEAHQRVAYLSNRSQVKWPHSAHNKTPSMAVDVAPFPIDWDDHNSFALLAGYIMCVAERLKREGKIDHQLVWGGDWNTNGKTRDHNFRDFPHFELRSRTDGS